MSKIRSGVVLLIVLSLALACGNDDKDKSPTTPGSGTRNGTLTATLSGDINLNFNSNTAYGLQSQADAASGEPGLMQVQGVVNVGGVQYSIDIQIYRNPATGTFQLRFPPQDGVGSVLKNSDGYFSESGSVTFTQVSKTSMAGTFNFKAFKMVGVGQKVTVDVTNGSFNVPVIYED